MDSIDVFNDNKEKFNSFVQSNKKSIMVIAAVIVAGVFGSYYWVYEYLPKQENEAAKALAPLHYYFKNDSMSIVINGDKSKKIASAKSVADKYASTEKGKEAALMLSIAYMSEKKYEEALDYIGKVDANDDILSASVLNMKAVCYSNLGEIEKAASYFAKAGDKAENEFSAEYYKRAGIHYESVKDYGNALKYYQIIADKYPTSGVGSDIQKFVYKMKAQLGEYTP